MFGMELWFVYAIISAITGGLLIFTGKIAAERNYDGVVINIYSYAFSAVVLFLLTAVLADQIGVFQTMLYFQPLLLIPTYFFYKGIKNNGKQGTSA